MVYVKWFPRRAYPNKFNGTTAWVLGLVMLLKIYDPYAAKQDVIAVPKYEPNGRYEMFVYYTLLVKPENCHSDIYKNTLDEMPAELQAYATEKQALEAYIKADVPMWEGTATFGPELERHLMIPQPALLIKEKVEMAPDNLWINPVRNHVIVLAGVAHTYFSTEIRRYRPFKLKEFVGFNTTFMGIMNRKISEMSEQERRQLRLDRREA